METGPHHMPARVLAAAIPVLMYSFICLSFGFLLIAVLSRNKDGLSYVLLFAITTTCTTLVSIIQQCNYIAHWHELRIQQYEQSVAAKGDSSLALGPLSRGFNAALFWIILYFYNVDSVIMLFWAIALVFSVWSWKTKFIKRYGNDISTASKVLALVLPAIFSALRRGFQVKAGFVGTLIWMNILMLISFGLGAVCVILILTKYLRSRLGFGTHASRSTSFKEGAAVPTAMEASQPGPTGPKMRVDSWLILRFTIAFIILSGFEIFLIEFEISRYHKTKRNAIMRKPDFSVHASVADVLNYLPGVTASLLAFLLFGTTAQHRAIYSSIIATFNPFNRKTHPSTRRVSGAGEEWRRMHSQDSPSTDQVLQFIEMDSKNIKKDPKKDLKNKPLPHISVTDHDSHLPQRPNLDRILASPHPLKEIGILEDCESALSSPARSFH